MPTIVFNGKTYNSLEEMPANERAAYQQMLTIFADKNGNGIPDFMEGDMVRNVMSAYSSSINVNGQNMTSLNDLPADVRQSVDAAFQALQQFGVIPGAPAGVQNSGRPVEDEAPPASRPFISREYDPTIQEEKSFKPSTLLIAGAALAICFAAAAVLFIFMFTQ